ncbi:hypothetical protein N9K77_02030, partial [bacterium]|nr:hypothetical protein [bacterium]
FLSENYSKEILSFSLSEVVRQDKYSTILLNATNIRTQISNSIFNIPKFHGANDGRKVTCLDVLDLESSNFSLNKNKNQNFEKLKTFNNVVLSPHIACSIS